MVAFGEQVQVHVAQLRAEAVGVFGDLLAPGPADLQQVRLCLVQVSAEQPGQAALHHFGQHPPVLPGEHPTAQGAGQESTHPDTTRTIAMGTQYCERIGVLGAGKGIELPLPKATVVTRACIHL